MDNWAHKLECTVDGHNKFWNARVERNMLFVEYGKIGTRGATQVKAFINRDEALTEMEARVAEKLGKGYKALKMKTAWVTPVTYAQPASIRYDYRPTLAPTYLFGTPPAPTPKLLPAYKANELDRMPEGFFNDLARRVAREQFRRVAVISDAEIKQRLLEARVKKNAHITAFQNFLLGVAHAMACRAALRWSAGHDPIGKTTMHGLPWNAYDGTRLAAMVKGEGPLSHSVRRAGAPHCYSNPLTWTTAGDIKHWLSERAGRMPYWQTGLTRKYYTGTEFMHD